MNLKKWSKVLFRVSNGTLLQALHNISLLAIKSKHAKMTDKIWSDKKNKTQKYD